MKPPFHADHVGSLLRPSELVAARKAKSADLKEVEDRAIRSAVARQEAIGLQSVTDGLVQQDAADLVTSTMRWWLAMRAAR
mgnify:CR=1 FL=1